ncbi:K(+)-transporting ATPase subunit F [Leeia oryzae]|nr:K(+)-transporting ATPase subunit F [Leeia oryzae]
MSLIYFLTGACAIFLLGYLFYALFYPEHF